MNIELPTKVDRESYLQILTLAKQFGGSASLVIREGMKLNKRGKALQSELQKLNPIMTRGKSWPGTELLGGSEATIYRFELNKASRRFLSESVESLYDWLEPNAPEDLALYRHDGSILLWSVAHEQMADLNLTEKERKQSSWEFTA